MSTNGEFKIEKGVPVPGKGPGRPRTYPFDQMDVGDSFLVQASKEITIRSAAGWYGRRNNKKFAVRKTDDGLRCWRVE